MKIIRIDDVDYSFSQYNDTDIIKTVKEILDDVRKKGDNAIKEYTTKFDKIKLDNFEISKNDIKKAYDQLNDKTIKVIKEASMRIRKFAEMQMQQKKDFSTEIEGNIIGQKIIPIQKIGCYVPGGRYPLPSSALMSIIPAKTAGVGEIIMCSPKIKPATIVAADIAGADSIFNIGGAQAIGAMAYGTETIPKVDKIVGPGNKYVTAAKKGVYGITGIDFLAGPSEIMIIADAKADPEIIVADLIAQSEHDISSKANLITDSIKLAEEVKIKITEQIELMTNKKEIKIALENSRIIIVDEMMQSIEIANKIAPEHLELYTEIDDKLMDKLKNYGSLFIGRNSAEVFGDYCSGSNHILPTSGAARYTGGLSVDNFLKKVTWQKITEKRLKKTKKIAQSISSIEGLEGHRRSAVLR